jgi:hypothetical protein
MRSGAAALGHTAHQTWYAHFGRRTSHCCWSPCRALLDGPDPRIFSCAASGDVTGLRALFIEVGSLRLEPMQAPPPTDAKSGCSALRARLLWVLF